MRTVQHGQSPIDLFSISNRDDLYLLVRLINNIEYSAIAGSYSETFAAMKLFWHCTGKDCLSGKE
jgi:hypothetical protein